MHVLYAGFTVFTKQNQLWKRFLLKQMPSDNVLRHKTVPVVNSPGCLQYQMMLCWLCNFCTLTL